MKTRRILSGVLLVLALALGGGIAVTAFRAPSPVMGQAPEGATRQAERLMEALCAGDYQGASQMLYGTPSLGQPPEDASPAAEQIWEAFLESLSYEFPGTCQMGDTGVTLDVTVRRLDINATLEGLDQRTEALLDQQVRQAVDSESLYDEDHNFRPELIQEVLTTAVNQALAENQAYREQTIPLRLIYDQDQWWVMPDSTLLEILSGTT